ncbi:Helix-turn-helix domain-containing protein [Candidatus Electrothrix laxa]
MTKQEKSDPQDTRETLGESSPQQENENLPIGKLLRQVREKKALTIHDISQETNISSSNLTAIELGNYNELPADTFIRGQIIIYAKFLDIDGPEAARLFFEERSQCLATREKKPFNQQGQGLSTKQLAESTHISSATWAISLLLLIITFLVAFSWYTGWNPFAYFFGEEPTSVSTVTAAAQPITPEPGSDADMLPNGNISKGTVVPSVMAPDLAVVQEGLAVTDSNPIEQDAVSE